jgi:hypothetical protein
MKLFLSMVLSTILLFIVSCGHVSPTQPLEKDSWLPVSYAQADSLYNFLGTTMKSCPPASASYGSLSVRVSDTTHAGLISRLSLVYNGTQILRDSVGVDDNYGISVEVNFGCDTFNIAVVLGDKDYAGNAMLRKVFVNGVEASGVFPFGEAKLFEADKVIAFEYVSAGMMPGVSTKRYVVYDAVKKTIACQFDQQ